MAKVTRSLPDETGARSRRADAPVVRRILAAILLLGIASSRSILAAPANDNQANAILVTGSTGTTAGSNVGATMEAGEPFHWNTTGGKSVWWKWDPPAAGPYTFDTQGSSFDTIMAVYRLDTYPAAIAQSDDYNLFLGVWSRVTFTASAGVTYYIAVDGYAADSGSITLNWHPVQPIVRVDPPSVGFDRDSLSFAPDNNLITLQQRQFVPAQGDLATAGDGRHAILQFDGAPSKETRKALSDRGVRVLGWVPRNAILAYVPGSVDLAAVPGIRWSGALQPSDKISSFLGRTISNGAYLVDKHSDVARDAAMQAIAAAGGDVTDNPSLGPDTFLVSGKAAIQALSRDDSIAWIYPASDAVIQGKPVHRCPGAMTQFGPMPNFVTNGNGWDGAGFHKAALTYNFNNGTADIAGTLEEGEVERALNTWSQYADIAWTRSGSSGLIKSMDILWAVGNHGDGSNFDGAGGVLAHCFYPVPPNPETIGGDMHLDDAETWAIGFDIDVYAVALHESGHGLGLAHSADPGAVMYAFYGGPVPGLKPDDINGIRALYSSAGNSTSFSVYNDGEMTLNVLSITKRDGDPWVTGWTPAAPFAVAPGASQTVTVTINPNLANNGSNDERLLVAHDAPNAASPYPGAVFIGLEALIVPPSKASNPAPGVGATAQDVDVNLGWQDGGGAASYDIYFGTDSTPDNSEFMGNQAGLSFEPGTLAQGVTYHWRIDPKNAAGTTTGDVWSFTTFAPPPNRARDWHFYR